MDENPYQSPQYTGYVPVPKKRPRESQIPKWIFCSILLLGAVIAALNAGSSIVILVFKDPSLFVFEREKTQAIAASIITVVLLVVARQVVKLRY